jgi:hypothetical protein
VFRWFRLYEKKRGDRRTGSSFQGRFGEAVFFGFLFLLGAALLSNLIFQEVTHPTGAPTNIGLGFWLQVLVFLSFVLLGGGGVMWAVVYSRTSAERRSALVNDASRIDLVSPALPPPREYPTVPLETNLINSPGVVLPYRLPTVESPVWGLLAAAIFSLAWNGLTIALTVYATRSWSTARPEWFLTWLLVPFICVGVWAIYFLLRQLVEHTTLGPLIMEISHHPRHAGGHYQLFLSMAGSVRIRSLEVHVMCEEQVEFHQGTDVRHEHADVWRMQIFRAADFRLEPGVTYEQLLDVSIPPGAMHSFQTPHNAVLWKLVVTGSADRWPAFQRSFPVIVQPPAPIVPPVVEVRSLPRGQQSASRAEKVGA